MLIFHNVIFIPISSCLGAEGVCCWKR